MFGNFNKGITGRKFGYIEAAKTLFDLDRINSLTFVSIIKDQAVDVKFDKL